MKKIVFVLSLIIIAGIIYSVLLYGSSCVGASRRSVEAWKMIRQDDALIVDVRTQSEYDSGHLEDSIHIPLDQLEQYFAQVVPEKNRQIVLYCRSGNRSGIAFDILQRMGYTSLHNGGGFRELQAIKDLECH